MISRRSAIISGGAAVFAAGPAHAGAVSLGAGTHLEDKEISITAGDQALSAQSGARGVHLENLRIVSSGEPGHGVQINAPSCDDWTMRGVNIQARGYGLLVNTAAGGSSGLLVSDFRVLAGADAIELNTPQAALRNSVLWGGHLHQRGGIGPQAGFALGVAHVDGLVAGGFVSHGSRLEGVHIEDGSRHVVLSSFVLRDCQGDGVRLLPHGNHPHDYRPAVLSTFSVEGRRAPKSRGLYCVYDPSGFAGRTLATSGYLTGFETGLWLDGPGLFVADHISVEDVDVVLELGAGARALGSFFSKGARVFVRSHGNGMAGRFHQEDHAPNLIVERRAEGFCSVEGFSFPVDFQKSGADLFEMPRHLRGRLMFIGRDGFWEADINGGADAIETSRLTSAGALQGLSLGVSGGRVILGHVANGPRLLLKFEGLYIA